MTHSHKGCWLLVALAASLAGFSLWDQYSARVAMRAQVRAVQQRLEELRSDVGRFDRDDWRDVVPDIETTSEQLGVEIDKLAEVIER